MTSVGDVLRAARESQDRSVSEIADELCITQRYLLAIEQNDLQNLPGLFFYRSFARQYAKIVGVDEQIIIAALDRFSNAEPGATRDTAAATPPVRMLDPIVEDNNRSYFGDHPLGLSVAGLLVMVVLCTGVFAIWNRPPQLPRVSAAANTKPVAQTPPSEISVTISQDDPQASLQSGSSQTVIPSTTMASPAAAPVVHEEIAADGTSVKHVVLGLSATEKTWLQITSGGKTIFSGFLQPSESKVLTGSEMATLKVGNAAGVQVRLNGKPIGPIGPRGTVRTVRFTPENFEILPPHDLLQSEDSSQL